MAVLNQEITEGSSGYKKEIDEGGLSLLLDTVQIYIYQFPVKSSTREAVSNSIDSITEKNIAKILLKDPQRVNEFYVEREGDIYKDSRFDKDYYDPNWLSPDDTVYIDYKETGPTELRDKISIKDNGVGLGGKRLEGYMKISYSSKRLSTKTLGTFGLGCKAPLSTGADFYSLNTAHNGKEFSFLIYKDKIDNAYSKWNVDGTINDFIIFAQGTDHEYKVYYRKTTKKNYAEVSWDVKKHQKRDYIDAIKSQLLYLKNPIKFTLDHGNNYIENIEFQAKILHETEDYILAEQHYYSRPHLIINGICYGFIDFRELELDDKYGSIGLKMSIDDISVTPSRESCVWNTKTKDATLKTYDNLAKSSEQLINETLSNLGLIDWIKTCGSINKINYDTTKEIKVLANLASLTGFSSMSLKYKKTPLKYSNSIPTLCGSTQIEAHLVRRVGEYDRQKGRSVTRLNSVQITDTASLGTSTVYLQYSGGNSLKSSYITDHDKTAVIIKPASRSGEEFKEIVGNLINGVTTYDEAAALLPLMKILTVVEDADKLKDKLKNYTKGLYFVSILLDEKTLKYEEIDVPVTFKGLLDSSEAETLIDTTEEIEPAEKVDYSKLRKLNGKVLIQYPRIEQGPQVIASKTEMKLSDLADCTDQIVYGTKEDLPLLHFLYMISKEDKNHIDDSDLKFKGNPRVCIVSQQVVKHFKPFNTVSTYLFGPEGKTLCPELKRIFTARWMVNKIDGKNRYFGKLTEFSATLASTYEEITKYTTDHNRVYGWADLFGKLPADRQAFIANSVEVQTWILVDGLEEATKKCIEKYGNDDYTTVEVFDTTIIEKVEWVLDFDKVFGVIFAEIGSLNDYHAKITPQLAMEIKEIIEFKKDRLEKDYPDLCC